MLRVILAFLLLTTVSVVTHGQCLGDNCDLPKLGHGWSTPTSVFGPAGATVTGGTHYPVASQVTSTAWTNTPGTLRYIVANPPCSTSGCQITDWAVSGDILITTPINLPANVTIDPGSAPDQGVQFWGQPINVINDNVILRNIRMVGSNVTYESSCITVYANDVVIDHSIIRGCSDEQFGIWAYAASYGSVRRVTVQNSIMGVGGNPKHPVAALVAGDASDVAFYRNLFVMSSDRTPGFTINEGTTGSFWVRENLWYDVVYGPRHYAGTNRDLLVDYRGNVFKAGPVRGLVWDDMTANEKIPITLQSSNAGRVLVTGSPNTLVDNPTRAWDSFITTDYSAYDAFSDSSNVADSWPTATCNPGNICGERTTTAVVTPTYPTPAISAALLEETVLDNVGPAAPCRDAIHSGIINGVRSGTRKLPYPPRFVGRADVTQPCGTTVAAPTVSVDSTEVGDIATLTATVGSDVTSPLVYWEVTGGTGVGEACEPGASTYFTPSGHISVGFTGALTIEASPDLVSGYAIMGPGLRQREATEVVQFTKLSDTSVDILTPTTLNYYDTDRTSFRQDLGHVRNLWENPTTIKTRGVGGSCTVEATAFDAINDPVTSGQGTVLAQTTLTLLGSATPAGLTASRTAYAQLYGGATGGSTGWNTTAASNTKGALFPAGTLTNLRATAACDTLGFDIGPAGADLTLTVYKNDVATALTCTLLGGAGTGAGLGEEVCTTGTGGSPSVTIAENDRLVMEVVTGAGVTSSCNVGWSTDFTPTTPNRMILTGLIQTNVQRYSAPGVVSYVTSTAGAAALEADASLIVPMGMSLVGIKCQLVPGVSTYAGPHTFTVWKNGAILTTAPSDFDCLIPASTATVTDVEPATPISFAAGDTISIGMAEAGAAGTVMVTLIYEPDVSGTWWQGNTTSTGYAFHASANGDHLGGFAGFQRTDGVWNNDKVVWPADNINIIGLYASTSVLGVPTVLSPAGATVAVKVAYHVEDPASSNSAVASGPSCTLTDAISSCNSATTVDTGSQTDAHWQVWNENGATAPTGTYTFKQSTVFSRD